MHEQTKDAMYIGLEPKNTDQIVKSPVFQQSAFWARLKNHQGWKTKAFRAYIDSPGINTIDGGYDDLHNAETNNQTLQRSDLLILIRPVGDNLSMAYVPYGPLFEPGEENRGRCLEQLSESLRPFLPPDCLFIRYDLLWQSAWANDDGYYDEKGTWLGPPGAEIRELRMNFDTRNWKLRQAPTGILPSNTLLLDLERGNDFLLQRMKPKTRYNIRLSQRKGVRVRASGMEELETWYSLYAETATRNNIFLHDIEYFKTVLELKTREVPSAANVHMLLAHKDEEPLAAMFLVIAGKRATYLYGASTSGNRNLMGTYALQWEAMQIACRSGCSEYDMFGVSPTPDPVHPMYGLYRFKSGFGGRIFHREGCWDYMLDDDRYEAYRLKELSATGYHI